MLGTPTESHLTFSQLRHELVVLFKLRVVALLLAAAAAGAFVAARAGRDGATWRSCCWRGW